MAELSQRARQLLYHAVMEYVSTGEPVGSRTLSKKSGLELSAASIRNVLADLEELGYLRQPHTSAGRVPTDRAFRLFIDALMETREISPEEHARIRERFEAIASGGNLFRETGRLLSELTGTAALVVAPRAEALSLKTMRFVRTRPGELLAVLVMTNGTVQNRFVPASVAEDELVRVHNLLDDVVEGRTLGELRELFARRLGTEKVRADELRRTAFELGGAAVRGAADQGADIVIEGQAKLLGQPEFSDASGVKSIVNALDERDNLVRLLDATLVARGVTILVGSEAGDLGGGQLSIVGTAYTDRGRTAGSVGVIGPTRMNYPKVVPLVTATASAMSAYIERESGKHHDDDDDE